MLRYIARRLLWMPLVLFVLVTVSFFLMRLAPGGPFSRERQLPPEIEENLRRRYHMDEPLPMQYLRYLGDVVRGDLGPSFKHKDRTVNEIIAHHLPHSALLGLTAAAMMLVMGVGAGIVAAIRQNTWVDYGTMSFAMIGLAVPTFVVGPMLVLLFAIHLHLFNVAGWENAGFSKDLVLPAFTLALPFAARLARLTRAGMLEVIHQDYIRTARAKGLAERVVILRHAMRGAMLPVVSFMGPAIALLLTGTLVVEKIFQVPGLGREFIESALNRDYTLVMGTVIVYGAAILVCNLAVDIAYGILDPRIRYS